MKKNIFIETISIFLIILFTYTAFSKLLSYEKFKITLEQSPMIRSVEFGPSLTAFLIPIIELVAVICLVIPKLRIRGLYISSFLMLFFTVYVFIMLTFYNSHDRPCSCGGVLQVMKWQTHLIFNAVVTLCSFVALWLYKKSTTPPPSKLNYAS